MNLPATWEFDQLFCILLGEKPWGWVMRILQREGKKMCKNDQEHHLINNDQLRKHLTSTGINRYVMVTLMLFKLDAEISQHL